MKNTYIFYRIAKFLLVMSSIAAVFVIIVAYTANLTDRHRIKKYAEEKKEVWVDLYKSEERLEILSRSYFSQKEYDNAEQNAESRYDREIDAKLNERGKQFTETLLTTIYIWFGVAVLCSLFMVLGDIKFRLDQIYRKL